MLKIKDNVDLKELEEPDIYGVDEDGYDDAYYDKIYVRRIEELLEEIE